MFGVDVDDVQSDIKFEGRIISGTSKYLESVNTFDMTKGHHFLVLHFTDNAEADSIKVSMDPTQGEIGTLDESGVVILQMKDDKSQRIKVEITKGEKSKVVEYSIQDVTFARKSN